ncbi:MAG: DUF454 family protein [Gammaproteobacteria bacterium]
MNYLEEPPRQMPALLKAMVLVLVGLFVLIGLVGLVLPIIPGILFLALAAWLLARVSSRFAFHLEQHPVWRRLRRYRRSTSYLSLTQQLKLSLLLLCRAAVNGIGGLFGSKPSP